MFSFLFLFSAARLLLLLLLLFTFCVRNVQLLRLTEDDNEKAEKGDKVGKGEIGEKVEKEKVEDGIVDNSLEAVADSLPSTSLSFDNWYNQLSTR